MNWPVFFTVIESVYGTGVKSRSTPTSTSSCELTAIG